jgi:transposase
MRKKKVLSYDERREFIERYLNGEYQNTLMAAYGLTKPAQVDAIFNEFGIAKRTKQETRQLRASIEYDQNGEMFKPMWEEGHSARAIAERFNVAPMTVSRALKKIGVAVIRRPLSERPSIEPKRRRMEEAGMRYKIDYEAGMSTIAIGAKEGVSAPTVSRALKLVGVQVSRRKTKAPGKMDEFVRVAVNGYVPPARDVEHCAICGKAGAKWISKLRHVTDRKGWAHPNSRLAHPECVDALMETA